MEQLTWFLTAAALLLWLVLGVGILRRPPELPSAVGPTPRRAIWLVVWGAALILGSWGPDLWGATKSDFSRDPEIGLPADRVTRTLRTPAAVQSVRMDLDSEGRLIRSDERLSLRLPVGLLLFFVVMGWIRWRGGREAAGPAGGSGSAARTLLMAGLFVTTGAAVACSDDARTTFGEHPERDLQGVAWDTLLHIQVATDDTLLFAADWIRASERGIWVLDRIGHRIAHFDWEGSLRWYAGRRGAGPGELLNPRELELDDNDWAWVLDHGTGRISGFDPEGMFRAEVTPWEADGIPSAFVVSRDGQRFFGTVYPHDLIPVEIDRTGGVRSADPLLRAEEEGTASLGFQARAAREPEGDRWVLALSMGDGMFRMNGIRTESGRIRYPEPIPFSPMERTVRHEGDLTVTTRRLTQANLSARALAISEGKILVQFSGETENRGRILDIYDFESGIYERSVLLPAWGHIGAWKDRILMAVGDLAPEVLVLRMVE